MEQRAQVFWEKGLCGAVRYLGSKEARSKVSFTCHFLQNPMSRDMDGIEMEMEIEIYHAIPRGRKYNLLDESTNKLGFAFQTPRIKNNS